MMMMVIATYRMSILTTPASKSTSVRLHFRKERRQKIYRKEDEKGRERHKTEGNTSYSLSCPFTAEMYVTSFARTYDTAL